MEKETALAMEKLRTDLSAKIERVDKQAKEGVDECHERIDKIEKMVRKAGR